MRGAPHNLGSHSVPRSNVPACFVLMDHSLNSQGRNQSQFSLAGIALGCYERCTHNTAVTGIIDLMGAKGLKSLRKKKIQDFGITSISINKCELREVSYRIQQHNTVRPANKIGPRPGVTPAKALCI